ncbi:MAG TPA: asparaginase [Candidatus Limnocylindria bacterium]|nr:asparaginase [Candidatus Limnocylindria bacterium]
MARLLVEVTRGARVESRHRGSIAVVSPSGELIWSFGDPDEFAFIRSSAKPFQLAPFVASGRFDAYDLPNPTESLAVMAASHSGEDRHVRTVQAILRAGGLTREVLACGVHAPFDVETAQRLIRDREPLTPLRHNCSGKHAGMALHAKAAGWPIDTYWQPDHPVQQLALDTVALMSGVPRSEIATATDGCGVVSFGMPIRGLGQAFARLADPSSVADAALRSAFERIRDAMMAHPELVGGDRRRFDTELMRTRPGRLVAKAGAEGVKAVAVLRDGAPMAPFGLALKIEDGDAARRAGDVATCAALARLGALDADGLARMGEHAAPRITDPRGEVAGEVRPVTDFASASH